MLRTELASRECCQCPGLQLLSEQRLFPRLQQIRHPILNMTTSVRLHTYLLYITLKIYDIGSACMSSLVDVRYNIHSFKQVVPVTVEPERSVADQSDVTFHFPSHLSTSYLPSGYAVVSGPKTSSSGSHGNDTTVNRTGDTQAGLSLRVDVK